MQAFLEGMGPPDAIVPPDPERALSALELADVQQEPEELARQLKGVLDRTARVRLASFPAVGDDRIGPYRDVWTWRPAAPPGHAPLRVPFQRGADGGWRFGAAFLRGVPELWSELAGEPPIDELVEDLSPLGRLRFAIRGRVPQALLGRGFLLENWQWIGLAVLVAVGVLLDRIVRFLLGLFVRRLARSERVPHDEHTLRNFERPFGLFVTAWAFQVLLPVLGIEARYHSILELAAGFVMAVTGVWAAYRLVDVVSGFFSERARATQNRFDDMLVPLLRRTLKILVTIVGLVYFASKLSEELYGIVAGISIGSLAVGFAAKDSIENLFGTFTVLLDKPFQLGDWITVGEIDGTVEEVGFRSTRVRTFYNSLISVPNSRFISAHVDNWGARRYRRIKSTLSLTYDTPPEKVEAFCEGVRELIRRHPYTRKDYYHVYLNQLGASSLDVLLYCFVETPDWSTELRERHRLFNDVLRVAERLGVDFAFPTQTIHVAKPEDLAHPDAPRDAEEALGRGRELARAIAERGLAPYGGEKPPPVVID